MDSRRPYVVNLRGGVETTLLLSPESKERNYPDAREVKTVEPENKARRGRKPATKKTEDK